jgi:hypothetical protein
MSSAVSEEISKMSRFVKMQKSPKNKSFQYELKHFSSNTSKNKFKGVMTWIVLLDSSTWSVSESERACVYFYHNGFYLLLTTQRGTRIRCRQVSAVKQLNAVLWCNDAKLFINVLLWRQAYAYLFACVMSQIPQ